MPMPKTATPSYSERDSRLRAGYDREAAQYDHVRYHSPEGKVFSELEIDLLRRILPLATGARLLDLPAGTGRLSVALSTGGATVVAGDLSANMLGAARDKARADGASRVVFAQVNAAGLPFRDGTFDAVVSFKFFHLVPNDRKRAFIEEMARVLKPGRPLVAEFNSPFYGVALAFLRYYFRKKHPGGMRTKCLFPDQIARFFQGLRVTRVEGVKLPLSSFLEQVLGERRGRAVNRWFGRLPGLKYLAYGIVVVAEKP
jgi:ubiquinone/menaquinone biosynthesis C-methylase UbiE